MKKLAISLVVVIGLTGPACANMDKGMAAYDKKDYATAHREFLAAAKAGDARAKLSIGMMHIRGQGVKRDFDVAVRWLREAAGQGDGDARMVLGDLYSRDIPSIQDHVKSFVWLTLALAKVRGVKRDDTLKMLHSLRPRMKPDEIERAQDLAAEWFALDWNK